MATTYTGTSGNDTYVGTYFTQEIFGLGGNDTLDGADGNDIIVGGLGNDLMNGNTGVDTASYESAGSRVIVSLAMTGAQATGGAGIDTLSNFENLFGSAYNDILTGNSGANLIQSAAGADMLDGGTGRDILIGGLGNDTYVVDSVLPAYSLIMSGEPEDYISAGLNHIYTSQSGSFTVGSMRDDTGDGVIDWLTLNYSDGSHFWHVDFSTDELGTNLAPGDYTDAQRAAFADAGHPGLDVSGDGRGSNELSGGFTIHEIEIDYSGLSPTLVSFSASFEQHSGNALSPALFGSINYNNAGMGEPTIELPAEGVDKILSSVSVTLPRNIEHLTLTGANAINGTGNLLGNTLTGNDGANRLKGDAGKDVIVGNGGGDTLFGDAAADVLKGGVGNDTLTGGTSADKFDFNTALSALTNTDQITDFNAVDDLIRLDNDIFTAFATENVALAAGAFRQGPGVTTAGDASDRIIYNTTSGNLFYDADGTGAQGATRFATLGSATHPAITAADFFIIA